MAAKAIYKRVVQDQEGNLVPSVEFAVIDEVSGLPLTIYSDRLGATTLTPPYFADVNGRIEFFVDPGTTFRVSGTGPTGSFTDRWVDGVLLGDDSGNVPTITILNTTVVGKINSVADIAGFTGAVNDQQISLKSWHPDSDVGGGMLYWDADKPKSSHNGGTVFSPTVPLGTVADYLDGVGETDPAGSGCWIRLLEGAVNVDWFGAIGDGITDDRDALQSCLHACRDVYIPARTFVIKKPLEIPSNTLIIGDGWQSVIQNVSVMNQNGITNYLDTATVLGCLEGKPSIAYNNINSFGVRAAFKDYKAGEFLRLPKPVGTYFVGQLVIVEAPTFAGLYPTQSFITEISEVGADYISFATSYGNDIDGATIRDMESYGYVRNTHIRNVKLKSSYYVGDNQFGLIGGYPSYKCSFTGVFFEGGIGYSTNSVNDTIFDSCTSQSEYTGLEAALLSSNVTMRDCTINQRAGFAASAFGVNGNKSSNGVMLAEGCHGVFLENNIVSGAWYIAMNCKSATTPFTIKNNKARGFGFFGVSLNGGGGVYATTITDNHLIAGVESNLTFGLSLEPGVKGLVQDNVIDVASHPIVMNRAKIVLGRNTFLGTTLPPRIRLGDYRIEKISDYITYTADAEFIKPKYSSSLSTKTISGLTDVYSHDISAYVNQNGALLSAEAALFFGDARARTITVTIGSVVRTIDVSSVSVNIKVLAYTHTDNGAVGTGGGRIFSKDGANEEVIADFTAAYPAPLFASGGGLKIQVSGGGVVRPMWFKSSVENSPAWVETVL